LGEIEIKRDGSISIREIREIRDSIGLRPETKGYAKAMRLSHSYFTARKDGKLIGFVRSAGDGARFAFIVDFIVRPEFQSKGIGTRLMKQMVKSLSDDGIMNIEVTYDSGKKRLGRFYRRLGFKTFGGGVIRAHK
jgi:ribosomal protein S18 acetylase RimI-like enzyme